MTKKMSPERACVEENKSRVGESPVGVREDDYKDRAAKVIVAAMEAAEKDMEAYCREHDEKCHLGSRFVQDYVPAIASLADALAKVIS